MCTTDCIDFIRAEIETVSLAGMRVLEVGAYDVNGSIGDLVRKGGAATYVGVDIVPGPGVDVVCDVQDLATHFGKDSFDVVVTTEMMEHVPDWRGAMANMKAVLRPGGTLLLTTRSRGCAFHGYPGDYWRYEPEDMREIFGDMQIEALERDRSGTPGIFVRASKPSDWNSGATLEGVRLYSIVWRRRIHSASVIDSTISRSYATLIQLGVRILPRSVKHVVKRVMNRS